MATSIKRRGANKGMTVRVIHRVSAPTGSQGLGNFTAGGATVTPGIQPTVIACERGVESSRISAAGRVLTFAATDATRGSRQFLIGWVPGLGSDRNATVTEAIEW